MTKLRKAAVFTDIHWGAKSNSEQHNLDNMRYIDWFIEQVKADPKVDHINFLGDWFENRSSVNVLTLQYAYQGAKKLSQELKMPIYFIIGNHDLYHRHTRDIFSTCFFEDIENFIIVDEPMVVHDTFKPTLYSPYLFSPEYEGLSKDFDDAKIWWGHFEFKDFIVTGYSVKMMEGPDIADYQKAEHIFSGHFHKRQQSKNVTYIGNTFPTSFADADDKDRGMMFYDYELDKITFKNWDECPTYTKCLLSNLIEDNVTIAQHARVKCVADVAIDYEESILLKQQITEQYKLREFTYEETHTLTEILEDEELALDESEIENAEVDDVVVLMLERIEHDKINNNKLVKIFKTLKKNKD